MKRRIVLSLLVILLVGAGVAAGAVGDRLATASQPSSCSVMGILGDVVEVQGVGAANVCQTMAAAGYRLLDPGTQAGSLIDCQYHLVGLSFTVRLGQGAQGAYLVPPGTVTLPDACTALRALGAN